MKRFIKTLLHNLLLAFLAFVWLVPIVWLVVTSFSAYTGMNTSTFFPKEWSLAQYKNLLFSADSVAQFPNWFKNTFIIACVVCVISTAFVLMVAYATSCMRFPARKPLMNAAVIVNLFPGCLIAKGFFDTIPNSLREAAYLDGASEATIFWKVVIPMSRPIIVYTVISSFLSPWMDFVYAKLMLNAGISSQWTVAIGLYNMLDKSLINTYFGQFCAGGVLVSIPISVLFVICLLYTSPSPRD